ncbi:ubinuclein-1 isoform X3 [Chrysoperla carnea]|uniref:ubinuclein-1 isoform X3 n=1 Tax=Chrysoperla carnea TaxID=189513 RepID=UPI001D06D27E|nr:ubinuclein-1 isoform X3 [Chrysoperla carnea]
MSEIKRVALTSIDVHKNKKEKKSVNRSFRFNLTLTESNEKSCPIFNYRELLESAAEKSKPVTNGLDPFGDDNDEAEVARIARQFEAKYSCPTPSRKKKKKYKGDWADMGAGYDETDSFIDNTDAYDEIVPEDIIPEHGGFYINSGSLEYKQQDISEMEDISSSRSTVQKNRKRLITSEDSDDENEKSVKAEKRPRVDSDGEKSTIKKLDTNNVNIIPVKKKPSSITDSNGVKKKPAATTVKELLKEKRDDLDVISSNGGDNKQLPKEIVNINSENKKTVLKSTSINDAIESVISAAAGGGARTTIENNNIQNHDESSKDSTSSESSSSDSSDATECSDSSDDEVTFKNNDNLVNNVTEIIKLPDNLSDETVKLIETMKMASQNAEGKVKFFSESVNKMLLRLHLLCAPLKSSVRNQVYAHLAAFVKCKKDTLIRRTKKLVAEQVKTSVDDSLARLKECIDRTMPSIIENYTKECQRINEKNTLYHLEMYRCFRLSQDPRADSPNGDKPKTLRLPKRKFPWTDQTRKILGEIVSKKRECFNFEKTRKKRFDQYLENYYRDKMVPLWPDGWMSAAHLIRESIQFFTKEERGPKLDKKENKESKIVNSGNNCLNSKNTESKSQKVLPKVHSESTTNVPNKLPVPVIGPPSLSIKAVSQNDPVKNCIKSIPTNSGITIEPIINKANEKRKTASPMPTDLTVNNSNLSAATLDSITALKQQGITVENSKKSNSRNNSPIPPNPLDLNTKGSSKPKTDAGITVRKLSELVPNNDSTNNNNNSTKKHSKDLSSDSDIEIIEIQDDDSSITKKNSDLNPPHVPPKSSKTSESTEKVRHHKSKKKSKMDTIDKTKAQIISQLMKEKTLQIKEASSLSSSKPSSKSTTTGSDIITKLLTDSLAVSVSRKPHEDSKSVSNNDPVSNLDDVMRVMKDLQELHELTGRSSDKSRDSNDVLRNNSPVSVIAVNSTGNNRQTPSAATAAAVAAVKNNSVSSTCKSGGGENLGFQDVFQKHLFQDSIDCNITASNNFSTSQGKIKIHSNSIDIYPYIGSTNSTTILPISTSQKYPQNLTISATSSMSSMQSQTAQHTGPAQKSPPY